MDVFAPSRVKLPVPTRRATLAAPVALPIVIVWAAAESPIPIARAVVPTPRLTAAELLSDPKLRAVPAVRTVALPERDERPEAARVVNVPAAGVVPPIAGAAAKRAARLPGLTNSCAPVSPAAVPATTWASVPSSTIPLTVVDASGAPAMARLSA